MKEYFVNIVYGVNGNDTVFFSKNLEEAHQAYIKTIENLQTLYTPIKSLSYSPNDNEMQHAIHVELLCIDNEAEEQVDEILIIKNSDYFFDENVK